MEDINLNVLAKKTKNYTGAEIASLIMSANTHAFARIHDVSDVSNKKIDISKYKLTKIDFEKALMEVKP